MRGARLDLKQRILDRIGAPGADVWTPVDFLDLGAAHAARLQPLHDGRDRHVMAGAQARQKKRTPQPGCWCR